MFYTAYRRPPKVVVECKKDVAKQADKDDCDVNVIVARHARAGLVVAPPAMPLQYGDLTEFGSLQEVYDRANAVADVFASWPAAVRAVFDHTPANVFDQKLTDADLAVLREHKVVPPKAAVSAPAPVEPAPTQ